MRLTARSKHNKHGHRYVRRQPSSREAHLGAVRLDLGRILLLLLLVRHRQRRASCIAASVIGIQPAQGEWSCKRLLAAPFTVQDVCALGQQFLSTR